MKSHEKRSPSKSRRTNAAKDAPPTGHREPPAATARAGFQAEAEFRLLAEQSLVGIAIHDTESYLYVNGRFTEIFGYTREEIIRMTPGELVAEKDRARVLEMMRRREDEIRSTHYTYQGRRKDGTPVEIDTYGSRMEVGGKPATITILVDITERKRAEEALRDSRNMLQIVLDSIPSAVFRKNRDLIYLGGNRIWLEAVGLKSSEEAVGKSDYEFPWGKEQADSFREYDLRVMESGIPERDIIEPYRQADGTNAWAKTNKVPLRDTEGNVIGILGTYEDITERKRAEEQVRRQLDELRRWYEATLGREDRIRELKREVNALCGRLGEAPRYGSAEPAADAAGSPG